MVVLQSTLRASSWTQFRSFSKSFVHLERFNSESLGSKISKQNLKDVVKQNAHYPGPYKPPLPAELIPVRPSRDLWKALGFTVAVGVGSFTVAYVSQLDQIRHLANLCGKGAGDNKAPVENPDKLKFIWENLTPGKKAAIYLIIGANALIFLMWKVKPLKPFMSRYFYNSFVASKSLFPPMLLSPFSNSCAFDLGVNMLLLYIVADRIVDKLILPGQFWAFYCTAAVFSSLMSLIHQAVMRSPTRALGAYAPAAALLSYALMKNPNARVVDVAGFTFTAKHAFYTLVLLNTFGLILASRSRIRQIDPACHLGGIFFGAFYALIGEQFMGNHFERGVLDMYIWFVKKGHGL